MFSEILKIIPKIDSKDLSSMVNTLQSRFKKIASGFGAGLKSAIKGGGIAGIGLALIDKILNPLKETQDAIDKMLKSSDDISTNAKQFNTTTGNLVKLTALAKASGLDQDSLFTSMQKFQSAVAEAKADPSKPSAVRQFTKQPDIAVAYFDFIQALQKMEKGQQVLVEQNVFGEKNILRLADFFGADFKKLIKDVGLDKVSSAKLTRDTDKLANFNDLADVLTAKRDVQDIQSKASVINEGMIYARNKSEQIALQKENARIASYKNLATISDTVEKMTGLLEQGVSKLGEFVTWVTPTVNNMVGKIDSLLKSPVMRLFKGSGKDK